MVDPMALRPRLSTGLLLSDIDYIVLNNRGITPFISVISTYRIETLTLSFWHGYNKQAPPARVPVRFNAGLKNKMTLASVGSAEHFARRQSFIPIQITE